MSELTFRYRFDDADDFGWLEVAVATEKFSGRGGFWVQWQDVMEFGESLSTYPIKVDAPLSASWGYEMQKGDDLIVSLEIALRTQRATSGCELSWPTTLSDPTAFEHRL